MNSDLRAILVLRKLMQTGEAQRIREHSGVSLRRAAKEAKVSAMAVQRWETGDRRPTGDGAVRYALLLADLQALAEVPP